MLTTEFQTESSLWPEAQTCDRTIGFDWGITHQSQAPLQSMLLGLHFRHHLTTCEKDLLQLLIHESTAIFLRLGEEYIHIGDACDVPVDAVPTTQVIGTDAIFTHRCRPNQTDMTGARLLHTVRIGQIDEQDVMLGISEPDTGSDNDTAQIHLTTLVDRFRQALSDAGTVAQHIKTRIPQSGTWLLVNRASGRVLAAGHQTSVLLGYSETDLIGQEYSALAESLSRTAIKRGIQLNNFEICEQHLTIVTILPARSTSSPQESKPFFSKFFAHMMRNKLSAIATASSHLESLAIERKQAEEAELAAIIQDQADELDRQIERFRVLLDYDRLQPRTTMIGEMIKNTVSHFDKTGTYRLEIIIPAERKATALNIPPQAGDVLLEAIILGQRGYETNLGQTQITVSTTSQPLSIEVTTSLSNEQAPAQFKSGWRDYVQRLASGMNLVCKYHNPDENTLTTVITPTANRK